MVGYMIRNGHHSLAYRTLQNTRRHRKSVADHVRNFLIIPSFPTVSANNID